MKKVIAMITVMLFFFSVPLLSYGGNKGRQQKERVRQHQQVQKRQQQRHDRWNNRNHPRHNGVGKRYGHYTRPYNHHYRNYKYGGHYTWHQWQRMRHHRMYRNGRYNTDDNGFLMYSFCDGGVCFTISID